MSGLHLGLAAPLVVKVQKLDLEHVQLETTLIVY